MLNAKKLSKYTSEKNKNMIELVITKKHEIDEFFFDQIFFKVNKLSPGPNGEHLLYIYLKNIFGYNKKINFYIVYHLLSKFILLKIKKSFQKHPCVLCSKYKRYDVLNKLFEVVNPFIKNSRGVFLLEEIYIVNNNFFEDYDFENIFLTNTKKHKNKYNSEAFQFFFENKYAKKILDQMFKKRYFIVFFNDTVKNNTTTNKKKLDPVYEVLRGTENIILNTETYFLDILGKSDSMHIFLNKNKTTSKIYAIKGENFNNCHFDIYDNILTKLDDDEINKVFVYAEIFKKFLTKLHLDREKFISNTKIITFENTLKESFKNILNIETKKNILHDIELSKKDFFLNNISLLITYQTIFSVKDKL